MALSGAHPRTASHILRAGGSVPPGIGLPHLGLDGAKWVGTGELRSHGAHSARVCGADVIDQTPRMSAAAPRLPGPRPRG
jgi:hypothetical protein